MPPGPDAERRVIMSVIEAVRHRDRAETRRNSCSSAQGFSARGAADLAERKDDITRLRAALKQEAEQIASVISADFGNRARYETLLADIWPVVTSARETLKHLARWMKPKSVGVGLELLPGRARILYQPVGVVGIISPWNYPVQLAVTPLIAALAAGNRVMLKPSELTPRTSEFLADFLGRLFPEEKVATILGGPEVGAAFSALPFDHLFYTGSTEVGRRVMRAAAKNLTPVTLELGGKSPCIIGKGRRPSGGCGKDRNGQAAQRGPNLYRTRLHPRSGGHPGQLRRLDPRSRHQALPLARCKPGLHIDHQSPPLWPHRAVYRGSPSTWNARCRDQSSGGGAFAAGTEDRPDALARSRRRSSRDARRDFRSRAADQILSYPR